MSLHPLVKLVVCLTWITAAILIFDAGFQMATIALAAFALLVFARVPPLLVLGLMVPFALFGLGFLTTTILFRQDSDFALRMAEESLLASPEVAAGIVLFLRAIACGMASAVFALTTEPGAFIKALMVNWGLPAPVGYSLFSAMHLVPDLAAEIRQIRLARAMRRGKMPSRIPGPFEVASLVVPLLAFAIRRASRAAIAMEARGLASGGTRTVLAPPRVCSRDYAFMAVAVVVLAGAIWLTWD